MAGSDGVRHCMTRGELSTACKCRGFSESPLTPGYTNYLNNKKLFPENPTFEDCQAVVSVEAMRKKLQEHSLHSPLVRRVFDIAEAEGRSEDDMMVMLAFHAVAMHEHLQEKFLNEVHSKPAPYILKHGV